MVLSDLPFPNAAAIAPQPNVARNPVKPAVQPDAPSFASLLDDRSASIAARTDARADAHTDDRDAARPENKNDVRRDDRADNDNKVPAKDDAQKADGKADAQKKDKADDRTDGTMDAKPSEKTEARTSDNANDKAADAADGQSTTVQAQPTTQPSLIALLQQGQAKTDTGAGEETNEEVGDAISAAGNGNGKAKPATPTDAAPGDKTKAADTTAAPAATKSQVPGAETAKAETAKPGVKAEAKPDGAIAPTQSQAATPQASAPQAPSTIQGLAPAQTNGIQASAPAAAGQASNQPMTADIQHGPAANLDHLAVEISSRALGGARQFDIRLDPPELGRVDVRLSIDAAGKAQAHMTADQPQTLELLQKDSSVLARALRDAGLDVSQDSLNFSLKGQNSHAEQQQREPGQRSASFSARAVAATDTAPSNIAFRKPGNGRLDIHV